MIKSIRTIGMSALAAGLGLLVAPVARAQDTVFVTSTGNVGIGTSSPADKFHIFNSADVPTVLRIESTSSGANAVSNFRAQSNTVVAHFRAHGSGRTINHFGVVLGGWSEMVQDIGNGFLIGTMNSTPIIMGTNNTNRLQIDGSTGAVTIAGNVGIGTTNPGARLHLFDNTDVFTVLTMENTSSGGNGAVSLHAVSNSATAFLQAQGSGRAISHFGQAVASWAELLQVTGNGLIVGTLPNKPLILGTNNTNRLQIDGSTGAVTIAGDLIVNGTFSNPSSRVLKENFTPLDPSAVLKKFAQLPINEWSYKSDEQRLRHVGPTVEDFRNAFGLGTEGQHIFPMDVQGVTMAAVQGLYQLVQEKEEQLAELQKELREIKQLLLEKGN